MSFETWAPFVMIPLQLLLAGVVVAELWLTHRLHPGYVRFRERVLASDTPLSANLRPAELEGFEGTVEGLRFRWDPSDQLLYFGRRFGILPGERGYAVGTVDLSGPEAVVRWHPTLLGIAPIFGLMVTAVILGVVLTEGVFSLLFALPLALLLPFAFNAMLWAYGRRTLERVLLPRLALALGEHLL